MRKFHILGGMPRAGTTLAAQLLSMNEGFHVTPTSAVLDTLKVMRSNFSNDPTWKAQDRLKLMDNFQQGMNGFLEGFFHDKDVVFDKCRGWSNHLSMIDAIRGNKDTKVLFFYRNPVEIIGSIEAQYQKTILLENPDEQAAPGAFATLDRRIGTFMNDGGIVSYPVETLRDALEMGYRDRILIVKYFDLTNNTQEVLNQIHDFIGEPRKSYDYTRLKQATFEFDGFYNYKFPHTIKEGSVKFKPSDVEFPTKYQNIINNKFAGLNKFVFEGDPSAFLGLTEEEYKEQQITLKLKK
jgi:sulfotransferase